MTKKNRKLIEQLAQRSVDQLEVRLTDAAAGVINGLRLRGDVEDLMFSTNVQFDEAKELLVCEFGSRLRELMIVSLSEYMVDSFEAVVDAAEKK